MSTWLCWLSSLIGTFIGLWYILAQEKLEALAIAEEPWFPYLPLMLLVVVLIEIFITIALRKYLLIIPSQKHKYDSNDYLGSLMFFCIHFIIIFIATNIPIYGMVLFIQTVNYVYLSVGFGIWLSLMVYHLPKKIYKPIIKHA